ncbi:MAG: hypothetical protein AAF211_02750 [Myxococcota bacterium]
MSDPLVLGPLNGGVLLILVVIGGVAVVRALQRVNRGEVVDTLPLVAVLVLPLLFAVVSANVLLPWDVEAAQSHPSAPARQTLWAMALSRSLLTALYAGLVVGGLSLGLLGGTLAVTVRGERPRHGLGQSALVVGALFWFVVAMGMSLEPTAWLVGRTVLYGIAVVAVALALRATHRRGPGVQLATISAVAFPLLVAGIDLSTIAWSTGLRLEAIAAAPATDKQGMMDAALASLGTLQGFSGLHLAFATALAGLGPLAVWRGERPVARRALAALATGVVVSAIGVGFASTWLRGF